MPTYKLSVIPVRRIQLKKSYLARTRSLGLLLFLCSTERRRSSILRSTSTQIVAVGQMGVDKSNGTHCLGENTVIRYPLLNAVSVLSNVA